jgi:20S proteasome subunit beta 7
MDLFTPFSHHQPISSPGDMRYKGSTAYAANQQNFCVDGPSTRTTDPIVTGTSVLGIKFNGGVMLAADTLASYGSLARFRQVSRFTSVGDTLIGGSGDISDFQHIKNSLEEAETEDACVGDGIVRSPHAIFSWLSRVYYGRRNKFNPLWNQLLVAGARDGVPFLGYVDLHGTTYEDNEIATGYGAYLARPLLRNAWKKDLTQEEAHGVLVKAMEVLYYRDCRALNRVEFAVVTAKGVEISPAVELETKWDFKQFVKSGFQ